MRLEATRKTDLAVRAMIALERGGSRLKSAELAEVLSGTRAFMAHVMAPLVKRGWIQSDPGPNGGYELLVGLPDVTMLELVEAMEGPIDDGQCVVAARPCSENELCPLHHAWATARTVLAGELATTSIADVAELDTTRTNINSN
jgi:Rrf2 family iron-sulfur cluster assembly transcriptional regulator